MSFMRASFFFALAFVEFRSVFQSAISAPGFKEAGPIISSPRCFTQPGAVSYPFLGKYLDQLNCILNSTFSAGGRGSMAGQLQLSVFGSLLLSSIMVWTYESFRPIHRRSNSVPGLLARSTSLFLLLGQRFTAGFAMPLQQVFTSWSAGSASDRERRLSVPSAEHIWSTLVACSIGYLGPTLYMMWMRDMDYASLSIWQPFPVYILLLNIVLPPIIRSSILPRLPFSRNQARQVGTCIIALLCATVSAATHWELLAYTLFAESGVDLRDVFLLRAPPQLIASSFAHAAHALFTIDFAAVLVTDMAIVLTALGGGTGGVIQNFFPFVLITASAGPGAAVIILWAYAEVARQSKAAPEGF